MAITFQNVTKIAGISSTREETFSVAWTDFNSDGRPDLWISPHGYGGNCACSACCLGQNGNPSQQVQLRTPRLYLNQGGGKFKNISSQIWPEGIEADSHGSSWADFDNDGDPDLFVTVGANRGRGENPKFLFVNNGGQLQEQAVELGLDYPLGRGRSSLWFDFNQDGLLDIILLNAERPDGQAPTALFQQTANGFKDVSDRVGLPADLTALFAQLADISGDGSLDLVIGKPGYPDRVYDTTTVPFQDLTNSFPEYRFTRDVVIADFDNNLHSDFFLVRNKLNNSGSSLFEATDRLALAQLATDKSEVGVRFKTAGDVLFDFREGARLTNETTPDRLSRSEIFIGSAGRNPGKIGFSLSPDDPTTWGIKNHAPGSDEGLYIGYDLDSQTWRALFSSPEQKQLELIINPSSPLSNVARIGFGALDLSRYDGQDTLLLHDNTSNQYVDRTPGSGLGNPVLGQSAVAGDFDNDMDVDLYISRGYKTFNLPNVLYENQGDGTFVKVPNAGGAAGRNLGPQQNIDYGVGSRMAVADYDADGFLDVFVSNTVFEATQSIYLGSPHQLYRNQGNGNHWIELDLEGVVSNRDGVGARILATAGGVTQLREQGGGMHLFGQNQQRIHFGLGSNSQVDLKIQWPSGIIQELYNVSADQVLQVVETESITGTSGNDYLEGSNGDDFIIGLAGDDRLRGLAGDDTLSGRKGNDFMTSGNGDDILMGGKGDDILTGWSGADRFVFNSKAEGIDRITDFSPSVVGETINVSKAGFGGGLTAGEPIKPAQFKLGSAAGDASDRFVYDKFGSGALYFDADGIGSTRQVQFATLSTGLAMTSADILVIA